MVERELLISILKLTEDGPIRQESVNVEAKLPFSVAAKLLRRLQAEGFLEVNGGMIEVVPDARLNLAVRAISLGADVERVSNFLRWPEFEAIAAVALEANGYEVAKNVRFRHGGRRWEIDVVGCRKPHVVCIDCKHWHHTLHFAGLKRMVDAQVERVAAFADTLPSLSQQAPCTRWDEAKFFPVILSLLPSAFKFYEDVPIVPVLQLQDFLTQMPVYPGSLKCISRFFRHL